jgi:tetratricopeptide (TPR) repeat protein
MHLTRCGLLAVVTVAATSAFLAADCAPPPSLQSKLRAHPGVETLIQLGAWFDDRHQYGCAAEAYRSALKLQPNSSRVLDLLGSSLYSAGDVKGAVGALQQAVKGAPDTPGTHLKLASTLEQLKRMDEAKAEWEAALRIDPRSIAPLDGLAKHLIAEGNYGAAIELLNSAPSNEDLTLDLVQAYGRAGMLDEAEATLRKALQDDPSSFPFTYTLATILVDKVRLQEATDLAQKYADGHPQNIEAQRLYLRLLVVNGDTDRALPLARRLLASAPDDAYFLYANGMMERQSDDYTSARAHLEKSVARDPGFYNSHYNLGMVLERLGDARGARIQFEKAVALGAEEPDVRFHLAKVLKSLGQTEEADRQLKLYREAAEASSKRTVAQGKATLAEKELASGAAQKAVALYREALESTPEDALLNFKLSVALDKTGDTSGERAALEKAIQINPDMAIAHNQLGYLASRSGDSAAAEEHFRRAVAAAPAYTDAWINLAATLGMESKLAEAQKAVASALRLDPKNTQAQQLQHDLAVQVQR